MTRRPSSLPPPPRLESASWTDGIHARAAWLVKPRVGETECGDTVVVRRVEGGLLVALIDALGHGPKAAAIARTSAAVVKEVPDGANVAEIIGLLHSKLAGTRGAAALLLAVTARTLSACSVGNIALRTQTGRLPFVLTPGVLGVRLRNPKVCSGAFTTERIVLFSDGISGRFDLDAARARSPEELVLGLFENHRHDHDDATALCLDVTSPTELLRTTVVNLA